jgi:protein TonB
MTLASAQFQLSGAQQRRLAVAVVTSLALHALAWHLIPPIHTQIAPLTRTLEVLLVAQREEPPRALEPAPPPPARPEPAARKPRPVEPAPRHSKETFEAPREPASVALPEPAPTRAEPAPAIPTRAPEEARVVALAAPSPDLLAGYGSSISRLLARHREYPRVAALRGWEGTVTMRLKVGANGRLMEAQVDSSSGHAALDMQALEMVKRIAELPPPPEGLRDREFAVLVPVVFRLQR